MSVDQISFITNLVREALDAGLKPTFEQEETGIKASEGETVTLKMPNFVIDAAWLNDRGSINPEALKRFVQQISATGLPRSYTKNNFQKVIRGLSNSTDPRSFKQLDISKKLSRVNILRVLRNLALTSGGRQSAAGFSFENFMALFFGGSVIEPNSSNNPGEIADVQLGKNQVSLKFRSDLKIDGSTRDLIATLKARKGRGVEYLVGVKKGETIQFFHTVVDDSIIPKIQESQRFVLGPKSIKFTPLETLNTEGALEKSQAILESVNQQFNGLLLDLQQLTEKVNNLTYVASDAKNRKSSAAGAKTSAEKVRGSAEKIEKEA